MTYEYESKLYANSVVHSITENVFIETGETKEIKEVYRKAKVFDEINIILDEYLGDVEDELNALNLIREKLEGMEDFYK